MDAISFGLAVIAEARYIVNSIQSRMENYRQGLATFQALAANLNRLTQLIEEVERLLQAAPSALSSETCAVVESTCTSVRELLSVSQTTMEELTPAFGSSRSGVRAKVKSMLHRTARAKAFNSKMSTIETHIKDSSIQLLQLVSVLALALKIQETQDALPKIENLNIGDTFDPVYRRPGTSAPGLRHTVILNFEVRDTEDEFESPEGMLKHGVLSSGSSTEVTAAAGVMKPAYGAVGMAGVGKTIALQGLAYDEDIRQRFVDGVLYMSLGQGATSQRVISQIDRIMKITGARVAENWASLGDVIDEAVVWFSGKVCLFLVDDLWPTPTCETGYLRDLQQLLRDSPRSRMAITTRSVEIARDAGSVVHFGARDPTGSVSEALFMKYATVSIPREAYADLGPEVRSSMSKILSLCAGLPIALAVTGCGVANLAGLHGNFKSACSSYAMQLEKRTISLGEEKIPGCTSLNAGILLSLDWLVGNWQPGSEAGHSISDLYISLCVFENQAWIPVSVLSRLWQLDEGSTLNVAKRFGEMSLASLSIREQENGVSECGLILHDLQLEFCLRQANEKKTWIRWHTQLLRGYLTAASGTEASSFQVLTSGTPRSWWSERVPEDDYIHLNLARHLISSGLWVELASLLLDARWTHLRVRIGGILALRTDFDYLINYMEQHGSKETEEVKEGFKLLSKSLQHTWGRVADGERALLFQLCGRLRTLRKHNEIVNMYLKSIEKNTAKPYMVPVNSFFPELDEALMMELPLRAPVTCSPCGRYFSAVADDGCDVVVVDATSGDILQRLRGHSCFVECITFAAESTKIVSGSQDMTAVVWKWEQPESPVQVFEGHTGIVTCVAISSDNCRLFTGSDDCTLRVWDMDTGTLKVIVQIGHASADEQISAIVSCANGRSVALGLANGALKVVDTDTGASIHDDRSAHELGVSSMVLNPNGALLATASYDRTVRLWNTETWIGTGEALEGHEDAVLSVAFSPDGQRIVSGCEDCHIRVWSVLTGAMIRVSPNLRSWVDSVIYSPDGKQIISGCGDGMVRVWDAVLDKKSEKRDHGHSAPVWGIAISHDGTRVVSGSGDGTLRLWDSETGAQIGLPMQGHRGRVLSVSFSPDGGQVVSSSDDGKMILWDMKTLTQIGDPLHGHTDWVRSVSFSFDGRRIVSVSRDATVRIWNVASREQIGDAIEAGSEDIDDVSESSDGRHVVARGRTHADSESIIWNRERRAIIWRSKRNEISIENEISDEQAKVIVRSCSRETPHIWPRSFPVYTAEVYSKYGDVYSNALGEKTLLGTLPSGRCCWRYEPTRKVFAAGLWSGSVAICKLLHD